MQRFQSMMPISVKLLCIAFVLPMAGCSTIAKRAIKEIRGARSKALPVPGSLKSDFSEFRDLEVAAPTTESGGLVSSRLMRALPRAIRAAVTGRPDSQFTGGHPVLQVEPQIQWYYEATGVKDIIGSTTFVVALLRLKANGAEIGRLQIVTKDESSRNDDEDLAESIGAAFADWIHARSRGSSLKE